MYFQTPLIHETSTPTHERIKKQRTGAVVPRSDASVILEDRFSIKLVYHSRSYLIRGSYRIENVRSFYDATSTKRV